MNKIVGFTLALIWITKVTHMCLVAESFVKIGNILIFFLAFFHILYIKGHVLYIVHYFAFLFLTVISYNTRESYLHYKLNNLTNKICILVKEKIVVFICSFCFLYLSILGWRTYCLTIIVIVFKNAYSYTIFSLIQIAKNFI